MRHVLLVRTRPPDPLEDIVSGIESSLPETTVETVDLTAGSPDYDHLLERIFEADSVQVW